MKTLDSKRKNSNFLLAKRDINKIITAAGLDGCKDNITNAFCLTFGDLPLRSAEDYVRMLQTFRSFVASFGMVVANGQ
jgi:hypothetical protein